MRHSGETDTNKGILLIAEEELLFVGQINIINVSNSVSQNAVLKEVTIVMFRKFK